MSGAASDEAGGGLNEEEVRRRHILPKALLAGVAAGLLASAFRLTLDGSEALRSAQMGKVHNSTLSLVLWMALGAFGGGMGLWLVRRFAPEAAGSGIPHLQSVVAGQKTLNWRRLLPVKFIAGVLGIGSGMTLGREGPTVQMGGASGLMIANAFRVKPGGGERKALISAGAGAGLAAAFNSPLAGLIFVLEELQGNFTPVVFVAAFLASVSADIVSRLLVGGNPVFHLEEISSGSARELPFALLLGIAAGLFGILFNRSLLGSLNLFDRFTRSRWLGGALAGMAAGFAGWYMPHLSGSGGRLADQAIAGHFLMRELPLLLAARFALTMICYGCGTAGGIFAPMLVLGSLAGLMFGNAGHALMPEWLPHPETFAVLGMGALFTAVVRAPLTGIVLMVEMTGKYDFMLPLLVSCLAAYGVAELAKCAPIYDALRRRSAGTPPNGAHAALSGAAPQA